MDALPSTRPIGAITSWLSGGTPSRGRSEFWRGDIPWISALTLKTVEVRDSDQRITPEAVSAGSKMAPVNSTLLLVRGSALHKEIRVGLVVEPVAFNQDVKALVPSRAVVPKYLTHALRGAESELLKLVTSAGNTAGVLDTKVVQSFEIFLPSKPEQARVVDVMDDVDDFISVLECLIDKKLAIKQGMLQQLLTGRTRLPGFDGGQWEWRPFPDVMRRINAKKHQIPASAYSDVGDLPVVDQGQKPIIGYTDDRDARFSPGIEGVVVFGDHTCITKFVDFDFAVGADGTQLVEAKENGSTRFYAYALEVDPVVSTGYNRHFKFLREKVLPVPERAEQDAIVKVLADVDHELLGLQGRLTKARAMQIGMMQQLLTGRTRLPVEVNK